MIIKGILKTIDYNNNSCTVRLPLFETSNSSGEVVLSAIFMNQPGMFNGYNEGDIVFVDFENNNLDTPVIIGKLYLGSEKETSNSQKGGLKVASLTVDSNATLPLDTKLVFNHTSSTEAPVDNRYANYKSLLDVIDALNKTEENISQVDKSISDGVITEIKVEYLSQVEAAGIPTVSDLNWQSTIPPLRNGYDIWQKTTCFNKRGQILGTPEIICLTSTSAVFTYWLKISTPVHTGANQKEPIRITAMSKVGTHIETEDTTASLRWKWQSDATWNVKEENDKNKYTLTIPTKDCRNEDLLIEAYHNDISYASETITFIAQNGPTLDLTRDTAQIAYDSVGKTKLDLTSSVSSTAALYFNGKQVQSVVNFNWTLNNCTASGGLESPTITITDIGETSDEASATCTVVYAGATCSKTFTITKARQGNTPYNLLIENSYVSLGTNSNEELETGWQNYTEHTISIYRNNELISIPSDRIQIYTENIKLPEKGLTLILKCENVEVDTLYKINANHTISIKLSDFTAKTGSITYTLYDGSTAVAADTFNIVKIIPGAIGASGETYWLKIDTPIHLGAQQPTPVMVTAMTKVGNSDETIDENAILFWKYKKETSWTPASSDNPYSIDIQKHLDDDIEVLATHNTKFTPDENTTALNENIYEFETITYSPLNTPVLDLSNDSAAIAYEYDFKDETYKKVTPEAAVSSTATVYLNTMEMPSVTYSWSNLNNVTYELSNNNKTITVSDLSSGVSEVNLICEASYLDKKGQTQTLTKIFTIVKQLQGAAAKSYWLSMSTAVHTGTSQTSAVEVAAMTKEGSGAEKTDTTAYLWYKFKIDSAWNRATDLNTDDEIKEHYKLVINTSSIKDSDLEILATHDNTFTPDENTTALSEEVYEFETITYSPLNTPVVDLSNDTDDLNYSPDGKTKLNKDEVATSTARLYLNGKEVTSNLAYVWTIPNGVTATGDKTNTIAVSSISDQSVKIRCTITIGTSGIDGKFGGRSYYKDFTVTKKLKGDKGDKGDNATNYKLILSKNIIKAETLANSPEVIISLTETTGNSTTYSSTGTLWIAGIQATVTSGQHTLKLSADTQYPIIVEWKNNNILLDSAEINLLKDGDDGEPAVVQNAFCWSSNYEYIPAKPNDILDNSNVGAWEENKWYIYDGAPTIEAIPDSKIIFFSKRSGIESTINTAIWSKPEVFAVADEDAYNVISTAKGLFGYGQGVYYTYDPSDFKDKDGKFPPDFPEAYKTAVNGWEKGKKIEASQIDIAKWIAKGNGESEPLKSVENRKKVIKLYINAEYIQTGSLKVERDTNSDGQKETLFEAGLDNNTVKIGGFEVAGTSLSATIDTPSTDVDTDVERSFNESTLTNTGITDITTGNYISLTPTTIYCHDAGDLAALAIDQEKFNKIYKDADLLKRLETRPWIEFNADARYYICSYSNTITDQGSPINDIWDIYIYNNNTKAWEKDTSNQTSNQLITNVITHYKAQVYVGTDRIEVTNGDKIVKLQNGTLFANSADISGTITATAGAIGGFKLQDKGLVTQHLSEDDIVPLVSWLGTPLANKKIWDATLPASENTFTVSETISGWEIKYIYYDDYNKDAPTAFDATGSTTEEQSKNKLTLYLVVAINNQTTQTYKFKTTITDYSIWERKELNDVTTNQQFIATKIPVNTSNTNLATTRLSPDEIFIGYEKEINPGYDSDYWFTLTPEMIETSVGPTADKSDTQLYIDIFKKPKPNDPGTGTPWDTLYFNPNNNIYINKSKLTLELGYDTTTSGFVHINLPSIGGGGSLIERPGTDIGITPPPDIGITPTPKQTLTPTPLRIDKPIITPDESLVGGGSLADSLATSTTTKTVYQCFNIIQIDAEQDEITWQSISENTSIKTRYWFPYKLTINDTTTEVKIPLVVKVPKKDSYVKAEANGALTATNASISGNLNAAAGKIGSFEIYENGLYSDFIELNKESLVLAGGNFTLKAGSTSNTGESISLNTSFNSSPAIIFSGNGSIIDQTGSVGLRFKAGESRNTIKYRALLYATGTNGIGGTNYITITIQAEEKDTDGNGTDRWKQFALQKDKTFTVYHKGWDMGEQIRQLTITLKAGEYTKTVGVSGYWMFYGASWTSDGDFIKNTDVINKNYFEQYEVVPASLYAVSSILPQSTGTTSGTISVYYNTSYGPPVNTYRYEGTKEISGTTYYVWSGNYGSTGHPTVYYTLTAPKEIIAVSDLSGVENNDGSTTLYYMKNETLQNNSSSKSSMYISSKSITITSGCSLGSSTAEWDAVYATTLYGTVNTSTSDLRLKQNISHDISKYDNLFDSLRPASYQFKSDLNSKTHLGFIAQEVEQSLFNNNLTRKDFAGVTIYGEGFDEKTDTILNLDKTTYALGYNELHALEVRQIQLLKARVQELEEKIEQLLKNK